MPVVSNYSKDFKFLIPKMAPELNFGCDINLVVDLVVFSYLAHSLILAT